MARYLRAFSLSLVIAAFLGGVAVVFLLILSGGRPVDFVQRIVLRLTLSNRQAELDQPIGTDDTPLRFTIAPGDPPSLIARRLLENGLIADPVLFINYLRLEGLDVELEAGTYFLRQTQSLRQIALALTDSRSSSITFTVLPGWRIEEVAANIDRNRLFGFSGAQFLALVGAGAPVDPSFAELVGLPQGASLEGFLFPETYVLPPDISAEGLRDTLLNAFISATVPQMRTDAQTQGLTLRDVATLASIIQREAVHDREHSMIASVYRNRLAIGMMLQADPTVQYGLNGARGGWWPRITQADYRGVVSPYNTYRVQGLPPGPIANPSLSALRAALYPAESAYYYFRARCDGSNLHNFSTTYEEHLASGC
jgi:UPF0755 protein